MSNDTITLNVQTRKTGKGNSRALRNNKVIPAVVYGSKTDNINLSIDELSVTRYSAQGYENAIFKLQSDDKKLDGLSVLMKEVTVHPVHQRPEHVDFFALDMSSEVRVHVEIKFEGKAVGVAEDGGVFQILLRDIEVECLPKDIPDSLTVNITNLALNEALHISDLTLPTGVKATASEDLAIANVIQSKAEEEATPAEGAATADAPAAEGEKKE